MREYTPFEFICIDVANNAGFDKKLFEERIQWVHENFWRLRYLQTSKKERPLYLKAVEALYSACKSIATGHMVGLDATCSGMSIMSVLTKCVKGCFATNLVAPDVRNDAYTMVTDMASSFLDGDLVISRNDAKQGVMTSLYGSQKTPRDIFGKDTPELDAFYAGLTAIAPGAVELLGDLRAAWQPFALDHRWIMPDNFHVVIKVMKKVEGERVEVDELGHSTFTYDYYVNEGSKSDLKLVANVTHSFDAYLLRSMERRCHYDVQAVSKALYLLCQEQTEREMDMAAEQDLDEATELSHELIARWGYCMVPDARLLSCLTVESVKFMDSRHIEQMIRLASEMLEYPSFELVTVHDEFKCHPNHCNQMRKHYVRILADLARGRALEDVYRQITGAEPFYESAHDGEELAQMILESNYALS